MHFINYSTLTILFIEHCFDHALRNTFFWLVLIQMEKGKLDKGGYSSISGPRVIEKTFSDMNISGTGFGSGSGLSGIGADMDSFASKPKGGNLRPLCLLSK